MISTSDSVIFALINEIDKRVYVSYSARFHQRLGTIQSEILGGDWKYKQMIDDQPKLVCKILENQNTKNFVKYYIDQYKKQGYYIYNGTEKIPLEYKFKMEITNRNVLVCAVNKRNEKTVLGTFKMYQDAQDFYEYIMKNNPAKSLVYAL